MSKRKDKSSGAYSRVVVEDIEPRVDDGKFPVKRVPGEKVNVRAAVFCDGHDSVRAVLLHKRVTERRWNEKPMEPLGNDVWEGYFRIQHQEDHEYTVKGYLDEYGSWLSDIKKKFVAGQDISVDLQQGCLIVEKTLKTATKKDAEKIRKYLKKMEQLDVPEGAVTAAESDEMRDLMALYPDESGSYEYPVVFTVSVEPELALFSSWYELFPRSWSNDPGSHGTLRECAEKLPYVAEMGFNVIYLPPIHPIGKTNRKGRNNSTACSENDPGCPWAIGAEDGGHKSVHSGLGNIGDLVHFVKEAEKHGLKVALDLAYQCSPDHPYVEEHPEWFKWKPDGSVQFAENPPKKYEDVLPLNFDTADKEALWHELKSVVIFWIEKGINIFRVDNPHTKPFVFWDWLIKEVKAQYPGTIFLAEAFTRPHVMYRLAKGGFSQSYTYFTWRETKQELTEYMKELTTTEAAEFFRPNFWPNTPDILPIHLQRGGRAAFVIRAVLASTLSSNYGIYGPAFELCVSEALEEREEYANSEKYEIKTWPLNEAGNIRDIITTLNTIRKNNDCFQSTRNIKFCDVDNDKIIAFVKVSEDAKSSVLVIVNLDPYSIRSGWVEVPLSVVAPGISRSYRVDDLLSGESYLWKGEKNYVELHPDKIPAHIFSFRPDTGHTDR